MSALPQIKNKMGVPKRRPNSFFVALFIPNVWTRRKTGSMKRAREVEVPLKKREFDGHGTNYIRNKN